MKPKDFAIIAVSIFVGAVISIFVGKLVFGKSINQQTVEVVPSISSNLPAPDSRYFNSGSIDATQFINIGNNQNSAPFSSGSNSKP